MDGTSHRRPRRARSQNKHVTCSVIRFIASTRFDATTIWSESFTDATPASRGRTATLAARLAGTEDIREGIAGMGDVRASATVTALLPVAYPLLVPSDGRLRVLPPVL